MTNRRNYLWPLVTLTALALGLTLGGRYLSRSHNTGEAEPAAHEHGGEQEGTLWTCGMHPEVISDKPGNCPICGMKLTPLRSSPGGVATPSGKREIAYWRAPMDPTYVSDKPGKSPMGMDLIPVYKDEAGQASPEAITIDPVTVQNMGIRTETVRRRDLSRVIRTFGHVDYNEERLYLVNTKISGWIEKLYVNTTGEVVRKGQRLLTIYSPELVSTQEEYILAVQNWDRLKDSPIPETVEGARRLLEASRQRLGYWDISDEQIAELEISGVTSRTMTIYSPAAGVAVQKNVVEGGYVKAGEDLFRIADISTIWVLAHIYQYELPWVKVGQTATMTLPYNPGLEYRGRIDYVYPYLDQMARDVRIRLVFTNRRDASGEYPLKPDMFSDVTINAPARKNVLAVPSEAVIRTGKRDLVFIDLGDGTFMPKEVRLGVEGGDGLVEVLEGVREGDRLVVSSQFLLDSESNLQEAVRKMLQARQAKSAATMESDMQESRGKAESAAAAHEHEHETAAHTSLAGDRTYYVCPMDEDRAVVSTQPGDCPKCGMDLAPLKEVDRTYYVCPMPEDSEIISPEPGKCPKCGMDLVPYDPGAKGGETG